MKAKTIKAVIAKKINEWAESIEDLEVRKLARENVIVTGGSIASMLLKEPVNDFDIYFRNKETALAIANYYVAEFRKSHEDKFGDQLEVAEDSDGRIRIIKAGVKATADQTRGATAGESTTLRDTGEIEDTYEETQDAALNVDNEPEGKKYRPIFLSTNAITLSGKVQLILRFYGEPEEIHKNYDFVHCTNYWASWSNNLTMFPAALESLLSRELRYVGSKYPVCSVFRLRKFIKRNWTINAGQVLKMCFQISELDLKDPKVLEDQLTGVDVAYFNTLIQKLKENDPEKVNAAYLVEIIDRMF